MFRPLPRTLITVCLLALALGLGRWSAAQDPAGDETLRWRLQMLEEQSAQWHEALRESALLPGERHAAHDALATLRELEALYRQEEALWTYFDTVQRALALRRAYAAERSQLEQRRQQQEADLARLDQQLQRLRPLRDEGPMFHTSDSAAWWQQGPESPQAPRSLP